MRKFFEGISRKTKILLFSILALSAGAVVGFKLLTADRNAEAVTQDGDDVSIAVNGSRIIYGGSSGREWSTFRYIVTNTDRHTTAWAMCVDAALHSPAGREGEAYLIGSQQDYYKYLIEIMLVTNPHYDLATYNAFKSTGFSYWSSYDSWSDFFSDIPEIRDSSLSDDDAIWVAGHIMVSGLYRGHYDYVVSGELFNQLMGYIDGWFRDTNRGSEYTKYNMYYATVGDPLVQDLAWLEDSPPTTGQVRVQKIDSSTGSVVNGATFALYSSTNGTSGDGDLIASGISAGTSAYTTVEQGYYCYFETAAPTGYVRAASEVCAYVAANATVTIRVENAPQPKGGVRIMKVDSETRSTSGQGIASIDGAKFGVYRTADSKLMKTLTISGGYAQTGDSELEQGSYYVQEISAGTGYIANTATRKSFTIGGDGGMVYLTSDPFTNQIVRGGLKLTKTRSVYGGGTEAFSGVTFNIKNNSTNETFQITTNENGVASTGSDTLIYGDYTVSEVSNPINEAFSAVASFTVNVRENGVIVDAGTKNNTFKDTPSLSTRARNSIHSHDDVSSSSTPDEIEISTNASVTDRIIYNNSLSTGLSYKLVGELYDLNSRTLIQSQEVQWTKASDTYQEMTFSGINTADWIGKTLSVKQTLYVRNNGNWILLSIHNSDLSDTREQVKVKEIQINSTTATSERSINNKQLAVGKVTVNDAVEIIGMVQGQTYTLTGELRDANGNAITLSSGSSSKTESYTMTGATGSTVTINMSLEFESSGYVGQTITVYQTLKNSSGTTLSTHPNSESTAAQIQAEQVSVLRPEVGTSAVNNGPGEPKWLVVGYTEVIDTISYSGLVSGNLYTVSGKLVNKRTGEVLKTNSEEFYATGETGTHQLTFDVDTAEIYDITSIGNQAELVVYEYLYRSGTEIGKHENPNDSGQTVGIVDPTLSTTATNNGDGNETKKLNVGNTSVKDVVRYTGLMPGDEYIMKGKLVNLDNGSVIQEKQVTFRPDEINGEVEMIFELDTALLFDFSRAEQAKLVVYEDLYKGDNHLGTHQDNTDEGQTVQIIVPTIQTTAFNFEDGTDKIGVGDMVIRDKITYSGLVEGDWYTVTGTLIDKAATISSGTTQILTLNDQYVRNSTTFKAGANGEGEVFVDIHLDTTTIQGRVLVAFETLRRDPDHHSDNRVLATHEELEAENQTVQVKVARIATEAKNGNVEENINVIEPEAGQVILDTISYEGLMRDTEYTLVGTLINKATGEPLLINGEKVTASKTFTTPVRHDYGEETVSFQFDASGLPGVEIVVFEQLFRGGTPSEGDSPVTTHEELDDPSQYIKVRARIGTAAVDRYDGDQKIGVGNVEVIDTVEYEGLKTGKTYVMKGTLVDKETGEEIGVFSETVFTIGATDEDGEVIYGTDGEVEIYFEFSTIELQGKTLVVFEELYEVTGTTEDGEREEEFETEHKDLEDASQTVEVYTPRLVTTATDKIDADKELAASGIVTIHDKVEYSGLAAGTDYVLKGTLKNRATGETLVLQYPENSEIEKELEFTARGETGVVEIEFEIDVTEMGGTEIVVFEDLYIIEETEVEVDEGEVETVEEEILLVGHDDIQDQMQTVWVRVISPETGLLTKGLEGAKNRGLIEAGVVIVVVSVGGLVIGRRIKKRSFGF